MDMTDAGAWTEVRPSNSKRLGSHESPVMPIAISCLLMSRAELLGAFAS